MCKSVGSTYSYCAGMNRLVATVLDHGLWTMQNAMMNLLLAISNGLGLKLVGYCFHFLEFHTYSNNKIIFITVLYIPHSSIYSTQCFIFHLATFMENIALFLSLILPRKILYIYIYIYIQNNKKLKI